MHKYMCRESENLVGNFFTQNEHVWFTRPSAKGRDGVRERNTEFPRRGQAIMTHVWRTPLYLEFLIFKFTDHIRVQLYVPKKMMILDISYGIAPK